MYGMVYVPVLPLVGHAKILFDAEAIRVYPFHWVISRCPSMWWGWGHHDGVASAGKGSLVRLVRCVIHEVH